MQTFCSDKELDCDLHELNYSSANHSSSFINTKYWQKELMAKDQLTVGAFFKLKAPSEVLTSTKFVVDLKDQNLITTNDEQAISITVESTPSQNPINWYY